MARPPARRGAHETGSANLLALGAIALWASLAALGVALSHVPPFLLTGLALVIGSVPAWPRWRQWKVPPGTLAMGVYGLFGYHFLLFVALRVAPPVEANLVNYLWPLLIVVMAPLFLPGLGLRAGHVVAAFTGFAGAALAILGSGVDATVPAATAAATSAASPQWLWGYLAAAGSAFIWASYSLMTRRVAPFPTGAVGLFGLVSGLASLACHFALETPVSIGARDAMLIVAIGLGPMGAAFFLWDRSLKTGDPRTIGVLSFVTPLGSTALLLASTGRPFSWQLGLATALIVGSALLGMRSGRLDGARARAIRESARH